MLMKHSEDYRTTTILDAWQCCLSEAPPCKYRGCNRYCYQKAPGTYYQFCGRTHADAHMAEASGYGMLQEPGFWGFKKCGLRGCNSQRAVDFATLREHIFCSKSHMLMYTTLFTAQNLKAGKLCQIEKCFRPVYVEEDGRSYNFCSLKHSRLAAAAEGAGVNVLRNRQPEGCREETNSNFNLDQGSRKRPISPVNQEGEKWILRSHDDFGHSGFDGGIGDQQLKDYLISTQKKLLEEFAEGKQSDSSPNKIDIFQGADGPKFRRINIYQGADISKFHPWEVVTESKPRYLLTITSKNKVTRQTRDGWCWKQTGPSYERKHSGLSSKYLSYQNGKEKCVDSSKKRKKGSWKLHEFSLEDDDIDELAGQIGLGKSARFRKAVILKMFQADNSDPGRGEEDHPTSNLDSVCPLPSGGEVLDTNEQRQSPPAVVSFPAPCSVVQSPEQQIIEPLWTMNDALWFSAPGDQSHMVPEDVRINTVSTGLLDPGVLYFHLAQSG